MLRVRTRIQVFVYATCIMLAAMLLIFVPTFAVHAAGGFIPQARLGFPAGDDWEPALAGTPRLSYLGVS